MPDAIVRRLGAMVLVALALVLVGSGPAAAHASLTGSTPEDGATLDAVPAEVRLDFNENVGNPALVLTAPDGSEVPLDGLEALDRSVTATPTDVDQRGVYTLSYRVVSADGHPIQGTIRYSVAVGQEVEQQEPPASSSEQGFVHRHRTHLFWGVLAVAVAIALILVPLRDKEDSTS